MSASTPPRSESQKITPPSSFIPTPLTPPPSGKRGFTHLPHIIALFRALKAGRVVDENPWKVFQLAEGEYDEIERQIKQDEELSGYVEDKIRYDYDPIRRQFVVRMATAIHERFLGLVKYAILKQLESIGEGSDNVAAFARKVQPDESATIFFPVGDAPGRTSRHSPDATFVHDDTHYPSVIFEVSYSQKRKDLARLAEDYLLDSGASVQVVIGLDIEYAKKASRMATVSVWRTHVDGNEYRAVQQVADEPFRTEEGNPTGSEGLRLRLGEFAYEELAHEQLGDDDREIVITGQQLYEFLNSAENRYRAVQQGSRWKRPLPPGMRLRKRSRTPPEQVTASDEELFAEQEEKMGKQADDDDPDFDPDFE